MSLSAIYWHLSDYGGQYPLLVYQRLLCQFRAKTLRGQIATELAAWLSTSVQLGAYLRGAWPFSQRGYRLAASFRGDIAYLFVEWLSKGVEFAAFATRPLFVKNGLPVPKDAI